MSSARFTTIPVRPGTRDRIKDLKRGGETYNSVIRRLADEYENGG